MIKILGTKRIVILFALIALNSLLAATVFMYLQPEVAKEEMTLKSAKAQESKTRKEISDLQLEFDQLEEQQDEFNVLRDDGFFSNQDRQNVQNVFTLAEMTSGVLSAKVSVARGTINQEEEDATKADHVLLESPVSITLSAIDDTEVYAYIDYLEKNFPGHITLTNLYMRRTANVNDVILRAIANGAKPPMVEANLDFVWRTMIESKYVMDIEKDQTGRL